MVVPDVKPIHNIAHVFPGQGSQSVGMGHELFQGSPVESPLICLCEEPFPYGKDDEAISLTVESCPLG